MVNGEWVYQCDGTELDLQGMCMLFNYSRKYKVVYDYEIAQAILSVGYASEITKSKLKKGIDNMNKINDIKIINK